jgi:hypothetical protein
MCITHKAKESRLYNRQVYSPNEGRSEKKEMITSNALAVIRTVYYRMMPSDSVSGSIQQAAETAYGLILTAKLEKTYKW